MVIKIIRPDILPVIKSGPEADLLVWLAGCHVCCPIGADCARLEVVREYEKTLIDELNLLRESANAIQLRRNFENSPMLYVPEVYSDYCSQNMMVMERIFTVFRFLDVATLGRTDQHEAPGRTWRAGLLHQVFRDSFFHADMHPGNIFVSYEHPENPNISVSTAGLLAR